MKAINWVVDNVSADDIRGWAIAEPPIREIQVYLAARQVGVAHLGVSRPDVAAALPDLPAEDTGRSGFFFKLPRPTTGGWAQSEVRVVLVQQDGSVHEIYRGTIISPGREIPTSAHRSPFPKEVCSLLTAVDRRFGTNQWTDALCHEAAEQVVRLVHHSSKNLRGLYPWLRYLKSMWASFELIQLNFPRFGETDPFRKDAIWAANSHAEMYVIAHHLYVLKSYGLSGRFLEFGCFKGFSTAMLSLACHDLNIKMDVFDSFQGLPASNSEYYREGEFAGSIDEVRQHVSQFGSIDAVEFHPGFFEQTVSHVTSPPLCLWMDVDLAGSSRDVMSVLGLLPAASCVFSHECSADNFGRDGIQCGSGSDDVVRPIVEAFARENRNVVGRFVFGNTGAFWDRDRGLPVLPLETLFRLRDL